MLCVECVAIVGLESLGKIMKQACEGTSSTNHGDA